ncbi:SH2 domain-containing protein [Ditylenchus destructor]|nr:SH2 domain-containing protein [Ditylenchus destructor]
MEEDHYDTPWEFKNRAIEVLRSQSNGINNLFKESNGKSKHQSADENAFRRVTIPDTIPSTSECGPLTESPSEKVLSESASPKAEYKQSPTQSSADFSRSSGSCSFYPNNERLQPTTQNSVSTQVKPRRLSASATPIFTGNPTSSSSFNMSLSKNAHPLFPLANSSTNPPQNGQKRLSFDRVPKIQSHRRSSDSVRPFGHMPTSQSASPFSPLPNCSNLPWTSRAYPLVSPEHLSNSQLSSRESTKRGHAYESAISAAAEMVHEGMERGQAEEMLKSMEVGDFLLRRRNDGNLALSLRSSDGVLHIKLEMRDSTWILGEGPRFSSINGMLRCYRKNELPVRGAEHVRLRRMH